MQTGRLNVQNKGDGTNKQTKKVIPKKEPYVAVNTLKGTAVVYYVSSNLYALLGLIVTSSHL